MLIDEAVAVDDAEHEAIMARVAAKAIAPTFSPDRDGRRASLETLVAIRSQR